MLCVSDTKQTNYPSKSHSQLGDLGLHIFVLDQIFQKGQITYEGDIIKVRAKRVSRNER